MLGGPLPRPPFADPPVQQQQPAPGCWMIARIGSCGRRARQLPAGSAMKWTGCCVAFVHGLAASVRVAPARSAYSLRQDTARRGAPAREFGLSQVRANTLAPVLLGFRAESRKRTMRRVAGAPGGSRSLPVATSGDLSAAPQGAASLTADHGGQAVFRFRPAELPRCSCADSPVPWS